MNGRNKLMDIQELLGQLVSSDSLKNIGKAAGASKKDVKNVLTSALPSLVGGLQTQASGDTAEGFANALNDHAKADTSSIGSFLSNVDLEDGGKIVAHLLGSDADKTTKAAAQNAGVSTNKAGSILSAAAPLLMSLVGQQTGGQNTGSGVGGVISGLLGNVDLGSVISGLAGGSSGGGILGTIMGFFKK